MTLVSLAVTAILAAFNAGAFYLFLMLLEYNKKERKWHDLAKEEEQKAGDEWNMERLKRQDFIDKRLRDKKTCKAGN